MNTACAEELNQLLKGTHMGASLFEDLKANVRDDQLRRLIDDCLKRLRKHEELLTHHVELMQEEPKRRQRLLRDAQRTGRHGAAGDAR